MGCAALQGEIPGVALNSYIQSTPALMDWGRSVVSGIQCVGDQSPSEESPECEDTALWMAESWLEASPVDETSEGYDMEGILQSCPTWLLGPGAVELT